MKSTILKFINGILLILLLIVASYSLHKIFKYNFFEFNNLNYIIAGVLIALILTFLILVLKNKAKMFTLITLNLMIVIVFFLGSELNKAINIVEKLNKNATKSEYTMSIAVLKNSPINDVTDLADVEVLAPLSLDGENINKLITDITNKKNNLQIKTKKSNSYVDGYNALLAGEAEAIVLDSAYENIIELSDPDFANKIKKIYQLSIIKEVETKEAKKEIGNSFNVYISGIDTFGPITSVARSDVNIIMSINKDTNKIILTTTPRDAYVKISGSGKNQFDKLTHAGVYGVETSKTTLENLYGIDIDYYARINFTSFIKLIDLVGGIDVYNDQEFTSHIGGYYFPIGNIHLDSDRALGFVRERYSLAAGDNDRGKNQQKVIAAIIKKLTSVQSLANYNNIINEFSNSIQTDMPISTIMQLANEQISERGEYDVSSQALKGFGTMGLPSFAMPGYNLYMMQVDEDSLKDMKININKVLKGK